MTEKKTDVLNLRVDPALAAEIDRIAAWRETSASEVARDLIKLGITVERQIEAQELKRSYPHTKIERDPERGYLKIDAEWHWYSAQEIMEHDRERDEWEYLSR
jgi:Ribbon-helix-helix protein, copG family